MTAINLAAAAERAVYLDCDVEEPNGRLFLKPEGIREITVSTRLPKFHLDLCTGCRKCVEFCRFHALMHVKGKTVVFPEVCHSCGGCVLACPENAITEREKPIGKIEIGVHGAVKAATGVLNEGEASGIPIIRELLKQAEGLTIIDCPPGSACSVMECVMDADFCVLVAEPTAFGFHNFRMVHELTTLLGKKCGVVINKEIEPYQPLDEFCRRTNTPVLARIPYVSEYAECIAGGEILAERFPREKQRFLAVLKQIGGV